MLERWHKIRHGTLYTLDTGLKETILILTWRPPPRKLALMVSEAPIQAAKEEKELIVPQSCDSNSNDKISPTGQS